MNGMEQEKQRIARRNRRIVIVGVIFTLCYLLIMAKTMYLQVFADANLSERASSEYCKDLESRGKRGTIYDMKYRELVMSTSVVSVGIHPRRIVDKPRAAADISRILAMNNREVTKILNSNKPFVWIKRNAPPDRAEALSKLLDRQVFQLSQSFTRIYPNKTIAAQILGFSGIDGNGLEGLEYYYDDYLKGDIRKETIVKDALGRIFDRTESETQTEGKNLILTIDANIQYIAEQTLKDAVIKNRAKSGIAMVMIPESGEIRAVAQYPTFNPNAYGQYTKNVWRNRAITDAFEPGSTMKIFTASAALSTGKFTPSTNVNCEGGAFRVGSATIHDTHHYGVLSLHDVVKVSSNIGAAKFADMMGSKAFYDTLSNFGFGEKTGIDCPGETTGMLRPYQSWRKIEQATIAFGQGITITPLQLIAATSAIANGGVLMQPRFVKAITNPDGSILQSFEPKVVRQAIPPEVSDQMKIIMKAVTEEGGTGTQAVPVGYTVAGKTGTAQILNAEGTYQNCDYNAVFVGFSPAESPRISVLVVIEGPQGSHYGGIVSAPAFREIVRETLNYMDVPPILPEQPDQPGQTVGREDGKPT